MWAIRAGRPGFLRRLAVAILLTWCRDAEGVQRPGEVEEPEVRVPVHRELDGQAPRELLDGLRVGAILFTRRSERAVPSRPNLQSALELRHPLAYIVHFRHAKAPPAKHDRLAGSVGLCRRWESEACSWQRESGSVWERLISKPALF